MIKASSSLQDLRRRLYVKAKAESTWRFWGLYVHVCKRETLREAYRLAKRNNGAPEIDGVRFEAIEAEGVEEFLEQFREELVQRSYRPQRARKVEISKEGGKVRLLSIPSIRWSRAWLYQTLGLFNEYRVAYRQSCTEYREVWSDLAAVFAGKTTKKSASGAARRRPKSGSRAAP